MKIAECRTGTGGKRTLYYVSSSSALIAASVSVAGEFRVTNRRELFGGVTDINFTSVNYDIHPNGQDVLVIGQGTVTAGAMVWIGNWQEIVRQMGTER